MTKYLVVLTDGMADHPVPELDGKTPLQYADTPHFDQLAAVSWMGTVKTVPDGFAPGSDVANMSVLGYAPAKYYTGRSPLEAVSRGIVMTPQDLCFRCNFVTLSDEADYAEKTMLDYSAGEITSEESAALIASLNEALATDTLRFHNGISYRNLMLIQGGAGKTHQLTPPHDISDRVIGNYLPKEADGTTAEMLLDLMKKSYEIFSNHPVNQARIAKGLNPANSIWLWGEGLKPGLASFREEYGLTGSMVAAVDLLKGIAGCAGLDAPDVEGATGGIKTNFLGKAQAALAELKTHDFVFMHIESADESGHQGVPATKVWAIEQIDHIVLAEIMKHLDDFDDLRILITPDHPTPVALKTHVSEPVPCMIFDKNHPFKRENPLPFNEDTAKTGPHIPIGHDLMRLFLSGDYLKL